MTDIKDILDIGGGGNALAPYYNDLFIPKGPVPDMYYGPTYAYNTQDLYEFTNNSMYLVPFVPLFDMEVDGIGAYINGDNPSSRIRFGIYEPEDWGPNTPAEPAAVVAGTGSAADIVFGVGTANRIQAITPTTLLKGVQYFPAIHIQSSVTIARGLTDEIHNTSVWNTRGARPIGAFQSDNWIRMQCLSVSGLTWVDDEAIEPDLTNKTLNGLTYGPLLYLRTPAA